MKATSQKQKRGKPKPDPILVKAKSLRSRLNPDYSVTILDLKNSQFFFVLDGVAAQIWQDLDGKTPLSKIKNRILKKYRPDPAEFEEELLKLLKALKKEKLLG